MSEAFEADFYHRVKKPYMDYLDVKSKRQIGTMNDVRAAMEAATGLYHLREQLPPAHQHSWKHYSGKCPDYGLLGDVVDTSKHGRLGDQTRAICNSSQIEEVIVTTEYADELGPFRHSEKVVRLHLTNGTSRDLHDVLTTVINFWQDELFALGLIRRMKNYPSLTIVQPLKREQCNDGQIDLTVLRGYAFKVAYTLQRYNYATGQLDQVDLTGADLQMHIFSSPSVTVTATSGNGEKQVSRRVPISEDELRDTQGLTEEEKNSYLMKLPQVQAAFGEIGAELNSKAEKTQ